MAQIDKILNEVPEIDIRFGLRKDLKQALYKDMLELIGKDEPRKSKTVAHAHMILGRNYLRQELVAMQEENKL